MERRLVTVLRECDARLVPTGDPIRVPKDAFVTLTQSLGGVYTIILNGNMARIDGANADALGFEQTTLEFTAPEDGRVSKAQIDEALASVYDPEIPVSIVDLGLVYAVEINEHQIDIRMTLTAPGCGMGPVLAQDVKRGVEALEAVSEAEVEVVFDPPWNQNMMSEAAKLQLGFL